MTEKKRIFCPSDDAREQIRRKLESVVDLTYGHYDQAQERLDGLDDPKSDRVITEIVSVVIVEYLSELFHRENGVRALEEAERVWTEAWDRLEANKPRLSSGSEWRLVM